MWFESPRRLAATLRHLAEALGDRRACVARELTKLHEEAVRGTLSELAEHFAEGARGEVTIVVAGATPAPADVQLVGDDLQTWGLAGVQNFDQIATELYLLYRNHDLDRPGTPTDDMDVIFGGGRVKF